MASAHAAGISPPALSIRDLDAPALSARGVELRRAVIPFRKSAFGNFNDGIILTRFNGQRDVTVLRVPPGSESNALAHLRARNDVRFAVLDSLERRQFSPNDPLFGSQWHHAMIGSPSAWSYGLGRGNVTIAIVDTPFQMDHPDLAANVGPGWDVVAGKAVTNSAGISHSTICAGMAAAVINNGLGVAGASNCKIIPISINGAISEMHNAIIWAADNGVRVVNISWSGGTNAVLQSAAEYLTNAGGLLIMSAIDGTGMQPGPNQSDVWCVAMTDDADNFQGTLHGPYIDFAAPGYDIYSTTVGSAYAHGTGCSFAAPLVAGVVSWMFSMNPTLQPAEVISILTNTAVDLGPPGWDEYYGWGRIDFGAAAAATVAMLPAIQNLTFTNGAVQITAAYRAGVSTQLSRATNVTGPWTLVGAPISTNGNAVLFVDSFSIGAAFYRVQASR